MNLDGQGNLISEVQSVGTRTSIKKFADSQNLTDGESDDFAYLNQALDKGSATQVKPEQRRNKRAVNAKAMTMLHAHETMNSKKSK